MNNESKEIEKSYELAAIIEGLKPWINMVDIEYAKEMADRLIEQGNWQDSAAVLNPTYEPTKSDALRMSGKALHKLVEFIECLKEVDRLKQQVKANEDVRSDIAKLFL